mgnify:CR=1 FL=1
MLLTIAVRLSTIVKADKDLKAQHDLCYRIQRKARKCLGKGVPAIKPVIIIDTIPGKEEQEIAGGFLDYFNVPASRLVKPEFKLLPGIRVTDLPHFFRSFRKCMKWYLENNLMEAEQCGDAQD